MNLRTAFERGLLVVGIGVLAAPPTAAQGVERQSPDLGAARALFRTNLDAIRRRDRAAYLACYLESDSLARTGPVGFRLGFKDLADRTGANDWPDFFDASDLKLAPVREGIVYGTYRYRVRYGEDEQSGLSERLFVSNNAIMYFIIAIGLGFLLPDFWLNWAINRRIDNIRLSLPDGLDFLAICLEAGLGLDQGIVRLGQELKISHPALSEEFLEVNFEQRAGVPRIAAWKSFSDRVDLESVRSFVAMLIQTDRFGTAISKSLSTFSDSLRIGQLFGRARGS